MYRMSLKIFGAKGISLIKLYHVMCR